MSLLIVSFVTFSFYENFRSFIILKQRMAAAPAVFACSSGSGSAATSLIQVAIAAAPLLQTLKLLQHKQRLYHGSYCDLMLRATQKLLAHIGVWVCDFCYYVT